MRKNLPEITYSAYDIAHELACMIKLNRDGELSNESLNVVALSFKVLSKEGEWDVIEELAKRMSKGREVADFVEWFHPTPENYKFNVEEL